MWMWHGGKMEKPPQQSLQVQLAEHMLELERGNGHVAATADRR